MSFQNVITDTVLIDREGTSFQNPFLSKTLLFFFFYLDYAKISNLKNAYIRTFFWVVL